MNDIEQTSQEKAPLVSQETKPKSENRFRNLLVIFSIIIIIEIEWLLNLRTENGRIGVTDKVTLSVYFDSFKMFIINLFTILDIVIGSIVLSRKKKKIKESDAAKYRKSVIKTLVWMFGVIMAVVLAMVGFRYIDDNYQLKDKEADSTNIESIYGIEETDGYFEETDEYVEEAYE